MKDEIHPAYYQATVTCNGCGNTFVTGSTNQELRVTVCSNCHPYYTGKQRLLDTERRVDKFNKKYARSQNNSSAA